MNGAEKIRGEGLGPESISKDIIVSVCRKGLLFLSLS